LLTKLRTLFENLRDKMSKEFTEAVAEEEAAV
jgi:hypothetical protein